MEKQLFVMGGEDFKTVGKFFYCTCDDIKKLDKPEIKNWFGDVKRITLDNKKEFAIMGIEPMISFTGIGAALIKVDTQDIPKGIYPTNAIIH